MPTEKELAAQIYDRVETMTETPGVYIPGGERNKWFMLPLRELETWDGKPTLSPATPTDICDPLVLRLGYYPGGKNLLVRKIFGVHFQLPTDVDRFAVINLEARSSDPYQPGNNFCYQYSLVIGYGGTFPIEKPRATIVTLAAQDTPYCTGDGPKNGIADLILEGITGSNPILRDLSHIPNLIDEYADCLGVLDKPRSFVSTNYSARFLRSLRVATYGDLEAFEQFLAKAVPE